MIRLKLIVPLLAVASAVFAEVLDKDGLKKVPGAYIIEFDENANAEQFQIQAEPEYETRVDLNFELFQGISIQLTDVETAEERAAQLASLPSVKNIWPVTIIDHPVPVIMDTFDGYMVSEDMSRLAEGSIIMTQIDKLHAQGITGEGVTIAIIDTGIDYHHPALGGCFGEDCLVAYGYDLVGDDYDGYPTTPVPDNDPDDCSGHGTHVAGIIAGQKNPYFVGAAPGVTLAAYRVFGCSGVATDDIFIAAFNRAYQDGAQIITASVGSLSGWSSAPWSAAVSRIVEKGIPCTVAAGNGGRGLFDASSPAGGKGVTAIASFDNKEIPTLVLEGTYSVNNNSAQPFQWKPAKPSNFDGVKRDIWVTGYNLTNDRDACQPLPDDTPDLREYNVLIRRARRCNYITQASNVAAKGARFFTVYSDQPSLQLFDVSLFEDTKNILGAAMVLQEQGESWVRALEAGSVVKTTMTKEDTSKLEMIILENTVSAGGVSSFSSWGPTFDMDFKPQFGAPGGYIMSTYPLELGGYIGMSGTSMATPLVAAAYALIAQARDLKPDPALFENLLASTANTQLFQWQGPFHDWLAPAAQQGAGLIQVYDAAYTKTYLKPSSLSFNDTANFAGILNFTIVNDGNDEIIYEISHVPSHTLYTLQEDSISSYYGQTTLGPNFPQHAELEFDTVKVTLSPGASATISVTATPRHVINIQYPILTGSY